jgi:hypothetical protein
MPNFLWPSINSFSPKFTKYRKTWLATQLLVYGMARTLPVADKLWQYGITRGLPIKIELEKNMMQDAHDLM